MYGASNNCLGCGGSLPAPFLNLGETPLANSLVTRDQANMIEPRYPLAVAYCPGCHLVQLTHTLPPEALFSDYLYFSSYSESYLAHAAEMADHLSSRFGLDSNSKVLEIASNDGYLLQYFKQRGIQVLGVEPAENIARVASANGIPTLVRFFGPAVVEEIRSTFGEAEVIIGNNVLAHVPDTNGFLRSVHDCLAPGGHAVFEFPYVGDLLSHGEFDTIYHEHVFYFSLSAMNLLAARAGLFVADVQRQKVHGGSLRVTLKKGVAAPSDSAEQMLHAEAEEGMTSAERFRSLSIYADQIRADLLSLLQRLRFSGKRIAAYGAPAKGNTLLNFCGIGAGLIDFTVDTNPHKQGLLLPGSRIPVLPPAALSGLQPDYALILPWNLTEEIVTQQAQYARSGGKFIVPIPKVAILEDSPGFTALVA